MAVTTTVLIAAKTAEASQTAQYTASGVSAIIDKFTATNYDTVAPSRGSSTAEDTAMSNMGGADSQSAVAAVCQGGSTL